MSLLNDWKLFALASAFFASLTAIFGKMGVANLNSNFATFFRTIIVSLVIAAIVSVRGEWQSLTNVPGKSLVFLTLSALATGFSWLCYYRALQLGPASFVAPVDKLSVALTLLLAFLVLGEPLGVKQIISCILIVTGSILLVV